MATIKKVKVTMSIQVVDEKDNIIVDIKPKTFDSELDRTHKFYLRRIRNFLYNILSNDEKSGNMGKRLKNSWNNLMGQIDEVLEKIENKDKVAPDAIESNGK